MYFLMFDYCTYLHINLTFKTFFVYHTQVHCIFIIVVIPLDTSVVLKGLPCLLLTFLYCLHHMSIVITLIIQFIWANLRMSVQLRIDKCIMFSIHFSLSQSEAGLGVWSLGSAEESQNSVDLTHISVDVRNIHFEENMKKTCTLC